jgi:hypothetical protein
VARELARGLVSYGGLGGPAILPLSIAKMAQMATAFPDKSFSGIGGVSDYADKGWHSLDAFRGLRRDRIVAHHEIKRPEAKAYHGGKDAPEGYAAAEAGRPDAP